MTGRVFADRHEAGRALADALTRYAGHPDALILALPRGGVPVGAAVAIALNLPLDVLIVRKLGVPGHPELAMGAIASGGGVIVNDDVVAMLDDPDATLARVIREERRELDRRERLYRGGRILPAVRGKILILVDDGIATGATMRAAVAALRSLAPTKIVVAVPTGSADSCKLLASEADEVICLDPRHSFMAVSQSYGSFDQTGDEQVRHILADAARRCPPEGAGH